MEIQNQPIESKLLGGGKKIEIRVSNGETYNVLRKLGTDYKLACITDEEGCRTFMRYTNPGDNIAIGGWLEGNGTLCRPSISDNVRLGKRAIVAGYSSIDSGTRLVDDVTIEDSAIMKNVLLWGKLLVTGGAKIPNGIEFYGKGEVIDENRDLLAELRK